MNNDKLNSLLFVLGGIALFFCVGKSFIVITGLPVTIYLLVYFAIAYLIYASLKVGVKGSPLQNSFGVLILLSILWLATTFIWLWDLIDYFFKKIKS